MATQLCHSLVLLVLWAANKTLVNHANFKEVISTIEKPKEDEQREIAKMLNDEMSSDMTLQNSEEKLSNLADEAFNE